MLAESALDVKKIRRDFPMLQKSMSGKPLVYLDNAASTQKPSAVIDRMNDFLSSEYANIHRGVYSLSQQATDQVDKAREKCRAFLGAESASEIIFTRGATEAINLVAAAFGRKFVREGDEIIVSEIEHHSNIVPWQRVCLERNARLRVIPVNDRGELDVAAFQNKLLGPRTRLVAVTQVSNALGTIHPVAEIAKLAHRVGAVVLVDGAQSAPHMTVDVQAMDCDFFCFSGHKVYGPTGIGVLYGKKKHLEAMDPYQSGGDMIESVAFEKTTYAKPPQKFEAGTPAIAEIIGLGTALDYLTGIRLDAIARYEHGLLERATEKLQAIRGLKIIGTAAEKASLISFTLEGIHPHDVGTVLGEEGIALRAGHHCAQPTMKRFGVPATTRASFAFYNTPKEIDALVQGIEKVKKLFS
jgi:cysteine desulfurase / selenocysteine lyase